MSVNKLSYLARLKSLVAEMEQDLGLNDLKETERCIYLAALDVCQNDSTVETRQLLEHVLSANITRPTFYRALKNLETEGKLSRVDTKRNVVFKVC